MGDNNKSPDESVQADFEGFDQEGAESNPAAEEQSEQSSTDAADQDDGHASEASEGNESTGREASEDPSGELQRLREALLRTRAEMDNLHKRAEREVEKSRKFAVESLLRDLVPIIDSLDQGIEASGDSGTEGLELTRKLALDTLKRYGLEPIDPSNEAFDPQWHEAMSMVASDDHASGQIITVLQRGYRLHDRVVRAARVIVAK